MFTKMVSAQYTWTRQMLGISGEGGKYERTCRKVLIRTLKWLDAQPAGFLDYQRATDLILRNNRRTVQKIRSAILEAALDTDLKRQDLDVILENALYIKRNGWAYYERMKQRPYVKDKKYSNMI